MPVWHASAAIQPGAPLVTGWSRDQRKNVEALLRSLLGRVGRRASDFLDEHPDARALHVRRLSTPEEEAYVGGARDVRCEHGYGLWTPGGAQV